MKSLVVFTEERSAKEMLESLLPKLLPADRYNLRCIAFEGKQALEKQLPIKLRGWKTPGTQFVVLRDQDNEDCKTVKKKILTICKTAGKPDTLVRIACRELESWYFGNLRAVETALGVPDLVRWEKKKKYRDPDSIHNPSRELKRITKERYYKLRGSREIGKHLELEGSRSISFNAFIGGIRKIMAVDNL